MVHFFWIIIRLCWLYYFCITNWFKYCVIYTKIFSGLPL